MAESGNTRVYVGNLPWATTKEELEELMSEAGVVVDARIMFGYDGKSKGCAIVTYSSPEEAEVAKEKLSDTEIGGRKIFVREDREKPSDSGEPAKKAGPGGKEDEISVVVSNLAWRTDWRGLKDAFKDYNVKFATVKTTSENRSRGFGIIKFSTKEDADAAIENLNNSILDGRKITVRYFVQ